MDVHLIDGTYELFRYHFALPGHPREADGLEVGAARGVLNSMLQLLEEGATHVGIATDHVIPSFRNELYDGYKDGSDIDPEIEGQFQVLEDVLEAAGFTVWPMVQYEADDALGSAAIQAAADSRVERAIICTPDKDLAQCVTPDRSAAAGGSGGESAGGSGGESAGGSGGESAGGSGGESAGGSGGESAGVIVQYDRRKGVWYDTDGVVEKFGVKPASIPDYLGLVGDTADGFPGLKGWGAKSAATVLYRYDHIEHIPANVADWDVKVRGAAKLSATLNDNLEDAVLFRTIATIAPEAVELGDVEDLRWTGPADNIEEVLTLNDATRQLARINKIAAERA